MEVSGHKNETIGAGHAKYQGIDCEPCRFKNKTTSPDGVCKECEEYMCDSCFENHQSIRSCRHHVMIDDMPVGKDEGDVKECLKHKGETIKFYCQKHRDVGCGDCMILNHKKCGAEFIRDVSNQYLESEEFRAFKESVKKLERVYTTLDILITDKQTENNLLLCKTLDDMQSVRKAINEHLDLLEARLIAEAKRIILENETALTKLEERCEELTPKLKGLNNLLDTNLYKGNTLFINAIEIQQQLPDIENQVEELNMTATKTLEFVGDKQLLESIRGMGNLGTLKITSVNLYEQALENVEKQPVEINVHAVTTKEEAENEQVQIYDHTKTTNEKAEKQSAEINDHTKTTNEKAETQPVENNDLTKTTEREEETKSNFADLYEYSEIRVRKNDTLAALAVYLGDKDSCTGFSTNTDCQNNPTHVTMMRYQNNFGEGLCVPFCLLLKSDGKTLYAFGREAEEKYADIVVDGDEDEYFFFDNVFASLARNKDFSRGGMIQDKNGRSLPIFDIISMGIRWLVHEQYEQIARVIGNTSFERDIQLILCVPAYFEDTHGPAWRFFREAALSIGINQDNISIVSDVEAVSNFYKVDRPKLFSKPQGLKALILCYREEYTYTSVYEIIGHDDVKRRSSIKRSMVGRNTVEAAFIRFLENICGMSVMKQLMSPSNAYYLFELRSKFIQAESRFSPFSGKMVSIDIPRILHDCFKKETLRDSVFCNDVQLRSGKLRLSSELFQSFYDEITKASVEAVRAELPNLSKSDVIILNGYFQNSILSQTIKKSFPSIEILEGDSLWACTSGALNAGHSSTVHIYHRIKRKREDNVPF